MNPISWVANLFDRYDLAGAVGLVLIAAAIWAAWGWIPVAALTGVLLIIFSFYGAK